MGLSLGKILQVALPFIPGIGVAGKIGAGLLAASDAGKTSSQGQAQQQAAANAYAQWLQQSQQAQQQISNLMPVLARQAGLSYTPGQGGVGQFGQLAPTSYETDPYYQSAYNAFAQPLQNQARNLSAQIAAGQASGIREKGYAQSLLQQQTAQQEAQFNRDYMTQDRARRDQYLQGLEGLLYGQQSLGAGAAAGLAGIGASNINLGAAQTAPITAALSQVLTPKPNLPELPTVPTPGASTPATPGSSQTLPPPGATGNAQTDTAPALPTVPGASTLPASSGTSAAGSYTTTSPDPLGYDTGGGLGASGLTPAASDASAQSYAKSSGGGLGYSPTSYGSVPDALTSLHGLIRQHTDPVFAQKANAIHAAIQGMF